MSKLVLLLNPPIYDFAAYDMFLKPLGLLYLASFLHKAGYEVRLLDALDRRHPALERRFGPAHVKANGTGKFYSEVVKKPACLREIPRVYRRYGLPAEMMRESLQELAMADKPPAVLVSSMMTYWYPGVMESIRLVREVLPEAAVGLGGVYARLMPWHARRVSGADRVFEAGGFGEVLNWLNDLTGKRRDYAALQENFCSWPAPAYDLYRRLDYLTLITSVGCPYHCEYCASRDLYPRLEQLEPDAFMTQLQALLPLLERRTEPDEALNVAFMDDALLARPARHIVPILERILRMGRPIRFYTPNGLHCRFVTPEAAELMYQAGFRMVRLSYEASDEADRWQRASDGKVHDREFQTAVENLSSAGFRPADLEAYILTGLPTQTMQEIEGSAEAVHRAGLRIRICQYTPIPGTKLFEESCGRHGLDPDEPLLHNNSIMPVLVQDADYAAFQAFKSRVNAMNDALDTAIPLPEDNE